MDASECCHELSLAQWFLDFRPVWQSWTAGVERLVELSVDTAIITDANKLCSLTQVALRQSWEATSYSLLWEQAFSNLAAVVHNLERAAQLALQQGTPVLWVAVSESIRVLTCPLMCLQLCQQEYLRSMPAAHQQQQEVLSQFFLTAGPQLLLGALSAEHANDGLGECVCMPQLAFVLQNGTRELLQPSLTAVLKRSERSLLKEGVGCLLDALELLLEEGCLDSWRDCILFDNMPHPLFSQDACHQPPSPLLLETVAAKPSHAALAFHYFAGGVCQLACFMQGAAKHPNVRECPPIWKGNVEQSAMTYLASIADLSSSFRPDLFSEAVAADPPLLGTVGDALVALTEQVEVNLCQAAPSAESLVEGDLLRSWAGAWEACASEGLQECACLQFTECLLAAAGRMVRIAAALGGWQQQGSPGVSTSSSSGASLRDELPHIWRAACRLAEQAVDCLNYYDTSHRSAAGSEALVVTVLQHFLSLLGGVAGIWQRCYSSSGSNGSSRLVRGTHLDPKLWLTQLSRWAAMGSNMVFTVLLVDPKLDPDLLPLLCKNHYSALMDTLSLALQVQVKAVRALEIEWVSRGDSGLVSIRDLSLNLSFTLKVMTAAFNLKSHEESVGEIGQSGGGGCSARWPPAAPYLHIIPAVNTLCILGEQVPSRFRSVAYGGLAEVLYWLLIHKGNSALHAGAGWLLVLCAEPDMVPQVLRELRASGGAAAALGGIPFVLCHLAKWIGARNPDSGDMQSKRQLSMDATLVLKRCCAVVDAAGGTNFAAREAECEWEGAQLLGSLLCLGLPNAADTVRGHVWRARLAQFLPSLVTVVQRGVHGMACADQAHGGSCGSSSGSSSSCQVPLCPRVAVESELQMAAGRSCSDPNCCTVLVTGGSKLLVCRGCQVAHYCSASCAQADWQRHRPVCRALQCLSRSDASGEKDEQPEG